MNFLDNYGLYNQSGLTPLYTPEKQLEMEQRRRRPDDDGLLPTYPTDFSIPDLDALLASVDPTAAPTGINPAAPPESQPPAVGTPPIAPTVISTSGPEPNKYERMEGVTLTDRLQSLSMTMSAVGTPQFADVYAKANHLLAVKQAQADAYNRSLDEATTPLTEIKGSYLVTYEPQYKRNTDGTYSINPNAGKIRYKERTSPSFETMGAREKEFDLYERMVAEGKWKPKYPEDRAKDYRYWGETYLRSGGVNDANRNSLARTLEETAGLDRDQAEMASYWNRDDVIEYGDEDGEFFAYNPATGEKVSFRTQDDSAAFKRLLAEQEADIQTRATITADQVPKVMDNIRNGEVEYVELENNLDDVFDWYKTFDEMTDEEYKNVGGWYNNFMYQIFGITDENATLAGYDQAQTREAVIGLKDAKVQPVSNYEFQEFKKLLGTNKIQDRRALVKLLERAVERKTRELGQKGARINDDINQLKYFDNGRFGSMYDGMGIMSIEETMERFGQ